MWPGSQTRSGFSPNIESVTEVTQCLPPLPSPSLPLPQARIHRAEQSSAGRSTLLGARFDAAAAFGQGRREAGERLTSPISRRRLVSELEAICHVELGLERVGRHGEARGAPVRRSWSLPGRHGGTEHACAGWTPAGFRAAAATAWTGTRVGLDLATGVGLDLATRGERER